MNSNESCLLPLAYLEKLRAAKNAAHSLRIHARTKQKNDVLNNLATKLASEQNALLKANQKDLDALAATATSAFRDRLALNSKRIEGMIESLNQVIAMDDPVSEITESKTLDNGLTLKKQRLPLGVVFLIFESRPNVAIESFSLAFKSGNALILRGGKESFHTVSLLYSFIQAALSEAGLPAECLTGITDPDRTLLQTLLTQTRFIDVVIPRGGDALIEFVSKHSHIPVIKNDRGLCHIYAHEDAALNMAADILENAKKQRPGVCNSVETLLIHEKIAPAFLPKLYVRLSGAGVENPVAWFACAQTKQILQNQPNVQSAQNNSWDTEYLDYKLNCKVVMNLEEALEHIAKHGSKHSESILTANEETARQFQNQIDAAAVYWNASTRFTDGFMMGLGGEIGISTQKLHVRGPVGLKELTSTRWVIDGKGQIRK